MTVTNLQRPSWAFFNINKLNKILSCIGKKDQGKTDSKHGNKK